MKKKITETKWFPYTVAACIAVLLYVLLDNMGSITNGLMTFLGYFSSIVWACVLAYIMNPLAKLLDSKVFRKIENASLRWTASVVGTVIIVVLVIAFLLGTLIPQLANSAMMLLGNMDTYLASLQDLLESLNLTGFLNVEQLMDSSSDVAKQLQSYLTENANNLLNASAAAGKSVVGFVIALILSIYMLSSKDSLKGGVTHLLRTLMTSKHYERLIKFLTRCDTILVNYIISSLLDAAIIGVANCIFMLLMGMQYTGLISVVVGVTNLIPTFGPIIGAVVGAFILVLVKPWHALVFLIFTVILQFLDPYVIKPKLFGNSLGVSGLLILVSVIVCGNMFGVIGILLAIPLAAILNFIYLDELIPALEKRAARREQRLRENGQ